MRLSYLIALVFICQFSYAKFDTIVAKSKITNVTVFFSGAQVQRQVNLVLKKGKNLVLVDGLPQELNAQSIQISNINNCKILSVKHQPKIQNMAKKMPEEITMEASIEAQELKIKEIKNKINVFEIEEKILLENSQISKKDEGTTMAKIKEAADFYRSRLNEIRQQKLQLNADSKNGMKRIQELYMQLNEFRSKSRKNYTQVILILECEKDMIDNLVLSYYVSSSGWEPIYDFRVSDISKPLNIVYNANVYQSSGEDWTNVNVKLSNNNPSLSNETPKLLPWYLGRRNHNTPTVNQKGEGAIKLVVQDEDSKEAIPFANVVLYRGNEQVMVATTNIDGEALLKPIPSGYYNVKAVYVGYGAIEINDVQVQEGKTSYLTLPMHAAGVKLDEVEIVEYAVPLIDPDTKSGQTVTREDYRNLATKDVNSISTDYDESNVRGGRSSNTTYFLDGVKKEKEEIYFNSNSLKTTVTNIEYIIETPYTINSDGDDNTIKIKEVNVPVNYFYKAIPKLETNAFLNVEIPNWFQLNLLSGKSSIYFEGTFVGQSYIDANTPSDTLSLSLGRDKDFVISRTGNKQMNDKRYVGNNIKETIGWDITIKNNKSSKVKMIIEDQFPISEKKSIEVERLESTGAKVEEKTGIIKWELNLEPNEKKVLNYKYAVKYPYTAKLGLE